MRVRDEDDVRLVLGRDVPGVDVDDRTVPLPQVGGLLEPGEVLQHVDLHVRRTPGIRPAPEKPTSDRATAMPRERRIPGRPRRRSRRGRQPGPRRRARRRSGRRRRGCGGGAEVHPRRLPHLGALGLGDLEELLLLEPERVRDHVRRERLDPAVVVLHVRVVEAPGGLDPVLRVGQFLLERQEVLVRLQVGVVLGHGEQLARGRPRTGPRRRPAGRRPRRPRGERPGPGHLLEHLALVRRVALHGLHEVGDQVVPAAQLGVDVRPGVAHQVPLAHEPVVGNDQGKADQHDDADRDPQKRHGNLLGSVGHEYRRLGAIVQGPLGPPGRPGAQRQYPDQVVSAEPGARGRRPACGVGRRRGRFLRSPTPAPPRNSVHTSFGM